MGVRVGLLLVMLTACGGSGDADPSTGTGESSASDPSPEGEGGEGIWICMQDDECMPSTYPHLTEPVVIAHPFDVFECIAGPEECGALPMCRCHADADGRGGDFGVLGSDCALAGRAGDCLYSDSEFPGCTIGDSDSCTDVCLEIDARWMADAATTYEVDTRAMRCHGGECQAIVVIDDRCFVGPNLEPADCALSDAEIFAAWDVAERDVSDSICG
jgi:hypothetical protein